MARFDRDQHLAEAGAPIAEAFFLEGGIASVLAHGRDGAHIEVGVVGHEGMVPVGAILGAETSPHEVLVQIDGPDAFAIATPVLRDLMRANEALREGLQRYAMAFLSQMAGTVMSNGKQPVERRLARWLLMCHDRLPGDDVALTHDYLALMLNIRRSSVTVAIHALEGLGAIRATRGLTTVIDRALLMDLAGEAYGQAEAEYRKLVGPFPAAA